MRSLHVWNKKASCDPEGKYIHCKEKLTSLLRALAGVAQAMETLLLPLKLWGSEEREKEDVLKVSKAL